MTLQKDALTDEVSRSENVLGCGGARSGATGGGDRGPRVMKTKGGRGREGEGDGGGEGTGKSKRTGGGGR